MKEENESFFEPFFEEELFQPRPIPRDLWSEYLEGPFESCTICGSSLADRLYEVRKACAKRYRPRQDSEGREKREPFWETLLEMAVCLDCAKSLAREYSEQSTEAIKEFFLNRMRIDRPPQLCTLCGEPFAACEGFSSQGLCYGSALILPVLHICSACEEKLEGLLSEKTRRAHEEFMNETFPGVPADLDLSPKIFL